MIRPVLQMLVEDTASLPGVAFVNASKHSACRPFYPHLLTLTTSTLPCGHPSALPLQSYLYLTAQPG